MSTEKPSGLIRHKRIVPSEPENLNNVKANQNNNVNKKNSTDKFANQKASIKISEQTKKDLTNLMNLTHTKFSYEMVESLIDSYVNNELSPDQQRAFRTLSKL